MEELANRLKETERQMEKLKEAHEVLRDKKFKVCLFLALRYLLSK